MPFARDTFDDEKADAFGRELDAIRDRVLGELGDADAAYIYRLMRTQRWFEVGGRGALIFAGFPPAWLAGTAMLTVSKILNNLTIGHNVLHGQYDWTGDPALSSRHFEWDNSCPGVQFRNTHNFQHHTYTNVVGLDRDIGFGIIRLSDEQPWRPYFLGNPVYAVLLMALFDYALALHDLEIERLQAREVTFADRRPVLVESLRKMGRQFLKDYVAFPLLAGRHAPAVITANLAANLIRNVWVATIIFCGHYPDDSYEFSVEETRDESRGRWYLRQILGSANFNGGPLLHLMSGYLTNHIEHHLFPYLPARRYPEIADQVKDICLRHGVPYNVAPIRRQFGTFMRRVVKLAVPPRNSATHITAT